MRKNLVAVIFSLLICNAARAQEKVYNLLDSTTNADIDYWKIASDNNKPGLGLLDNAFKPLRGKYTVYRFLATYRGLSHADSMATFHDIIILKTARDGKILDGYQYTLEWAEMPFDTDLYGSTCVDTWLTNNMAIEKLKFVVVAYHDKVDKVLKDSGYIRY